MNDNAVPSATEWTQQDKERADLLLIELDLLLKQEGRMSKTGVLMQESLSEVCNPLLNPDPINPLSAPKK